MKILRFFSLLAFLTLFYSQIKAQIIIEGTVKDTDSNPVVNALIQIFESEDKSNTFSTYTDQNGYFIINNIYSDVIDNEVNIPNDQIILRNYPNPFNPSTIIYYELPESGRIEIKIYDILGQEIRSLLNKFQKNGTYNIIWDGKNNWGTAVAAGIYLCRLKNQNHFKVHKMVLLDGGSQQAIPNNSKLLKPQLHKIIKQANQFKFTIKVNRKYINPIEIRDISCSGDTTLELTATKPIVKVMGTEGGIFSNDEFYLNIPASGFNTNVELRLYTIPEQKSSNETIVSKTYRLEGIPDSYNQPLKIGLQYDGELKNESTIEFGVNSYIPELEDSLIIYYPAAAYDSAGYLWANFPDLNLTSNYESQNNYLVKNTHIQNNLNKKIMYIKAKSNTKLIETDNFWGRLPEYTWNVPILNYLEVSYNKFKEMGFSFQPDDIPLNGNKCQVISHYFDAYGRGPDEGYIFGNADAYIGEKFTKNDFYRQINVDFFWWLFLDDYPFKNRLQESGGIVLFEALSKVYDTKEVRDMRSYKNDRLWFHTAASFWTGELFSTEANYIPPGFKGNELSPFHGLVIGAGTNDEREAILHGYGMTSLLKYLMDKAKLEGRFNIFLSDVYLDIFNELHPVEALVKNMNKPVEVWLHDYYKEYISGNIYDVPCPVFLNASDKDLLKIEVNDNTSSSAVLSKEYPDLSAKMYRFDLNYNETKENNLLQLKPEYFLTTAINPTTLIFGLKNEKLEYINGGIGTVICNIKEAQDNGYKTLLAAVVNNFYDPINFDHNSQIDLSVKIKEKDSLNYTIVKVSTLGTFKYNDGTTYESSYLYNPGSGKARYGTFENGQFESQWLDYYSEGEIKLNIDLNSVPKKIVDFYVKEITMLESSVEIEIIEGNNVNIPGYKRSYGGYEFNLNGTEICDKINTLKDEYQGTDNYSWSLIEKKCDNDSYIQIILGSD